MASLTKTFIKKQDVKTTLFGCHNDVKTIKQFLGNVVNILRMNN